MTFDSTPAYSGFRSGQVGTAYNEAAFRHFLEVDRSRAQRSQRPLYLILVALRERPGRHANLTDTTATALFEGLGASVREVDFVGWYQEGRVAAAVLAQSANAPDTADRVIAERVSAALKQRLSQSQSPNLRVRVVRLGGRVESICR